MNHDSPPADLFKPPLFPLTNPARCADNVGVLAGDALKLLARPWVGAALCAILLSFTGCGGGGGGGGKGRSGAPVVPVAAGQGNTTTPANNSGAPRQDDLTPPATPTGVTVASTLAGYEVRWQAVGDADLKGYLVYRATEGGQPQRLSTLLTSPRYLLGVLETPGVFYFSVSAVDTTGNESARSAAVKVTVKAPVASTDVTPPPTPTGLSLQHGATVGYALSWQGVNAADLAGYYVWQIVDGAQVRLSGQLITTSFTLGEMPPGSYGFHVSAVDKNHNESPLSVPATLTIAQTPPENPQDTTPPATPTGLLLVENGQGLTLQWDLSTEADLLGFVVQRSVNGGPWETISGLLTPTSFFLGQLTQEGTWRFTVLAHDKNGNASLPSDPVEWVVKPPPLEVIVGEEPGDGGGDDGGPAPDVTPPATPTGLGATPGNAQVVLQWSAVAGGDVAGYHIYMASAPGSGGVRLTQSPVSAPSFTATGLVNGQTRYFLVSAVDTTGNESAQTAAVAATPVAPDLTPPAVPTGLTATGQDGAVLLNWTPPTDADLKEVVVYGGPSGAALPQLQVVGKTTTSLQLTGLTNGVTYAFALSARDNLGNESAQTSPALATPAPPVPGDVTPPTAPVILSGSAWSQTVAITWLAVQETDLLGYRVYTTTAADFSNPSLVTNHHPGAPATGVSFTLGGLTNGVAVKLVVAAVDQTGNESVTSAPISLTPPLPPPHDWPGFMRSPGHDGASDATGAPAPVLAWAETIGTDIVSAPLMVSRNPGGTGPADQVLYFGGNDKVVHARRLSNGAVLWNSAVDNWVGATPLYVRSRDTLVVPTYGGKVYCFNAQTGATLWLANVATQQIVSSPVADDEKVYMGSFNGQVYALDLDTGVTAWSHNTGGQVWSSPALSEDGATVFIASKVSNPGGLVRALDTASGAMRWQFVIGTGKSEYSSPALAGGKLYIGGHNNQVYELNQTSGVLLRSFTTGAPVDSTPLVTADTLYFGSGSAITGNVPSKLFAVDLASFTQKWVYEFQDIVEASPILLGAQVCVGSWDTTFACFDTTTGARGFEATVGGAIHAPAAAALGYLAFTSRDGALSVYRY